MKLYDFHWSGAAFRTRIALNLKGVAYEKVLVNLRENDQFAESYRRLNPQARIPSLELDDGTVLFQSPAIIEYLEEVYPEPPFLPADPVGRARVRGLASIIACDIHPLNNLSVLRFLRNDLGVDKDGELRWYRNWIARGFEGLEPLLADSPQTGRFCHGDAPGLADICLAAQVTAAKRYDCDLDPYPTMMRIYEACMAIDAFDAAHPLNQPEAAELG